MCAVRFHKEFINKVSFNTLPDKPARTWVWTKKTFKHKRTFESSQNVSSPDIQMTSWSQSFPGKSSIQAVILGPEAVPACPGRDFSVVST